MLFIASPGPAIKHVVIELEKLKPIQAGGLGAFAEELARAGHIHLVVAVYAYAKERTSPIRWTQNNGSSVATRKTLGGTRTVAVDTHADGAGFSPTSTARFPKGTRALRALVRLVQEERIPG